MKKVTNFFAVMVIAVFSCFAVNFENACEIEIHGHAHASGVGRWQCNICGLQMSSPSRPADFGCEVSRNMNHSWYVLRHPGEDGTIRYQCVNCGWQTSCGTGSVPNELGCPNGVSEFSRHIWKRLN